MMTPTTAFVDPVLMTPTPLQLLWFLLIGLIIIGYFVLDGFDLGSGALYPFIAKTEREKALVRRSIGPVWDGNEVWLLTGGGALFAAFAPAYATSFSGFYLAIMLVLFALIARAIAIEFRAHEKSLPRFFDGAFFIGSALPALLFGVAVGNLIQGIPLNSAGDYAGLPLIGLLRPFPLACGLVSLAVMLLQGAAWQTLKQPLESLLRERALKLRRVFLVAVPVVFAVAAALYFVVCQPALGGASPAELIRYVAVAVIVAGIIVGLILHGYAAKHENAAKYENAAKRESTVKHPGHKEANLKADIKKDAKARLKKQDVGTFLAASAIPVGLILLTAASLYPYLVPSTGPGPSITIASAGGSDLALTVMTIIACIGVPLVLVYHVISYRTFRGRLKDEDISH